MFVSTLTIERERWMVHYCQDKDCEEFSLEYRILTGYGGALMIEPLCRSSKSVVTRASILDVTDRKNATEE
jgi:hypothetical protein